MIEDSCFNLAINVVPLVAEIATYPFFTICDLWVRVEVHLLAEVTELVLVVGIIASTAQVVGLTHYSIVSSWPSASAPEILKSDWGILFANFIATLAICFVVSESCGIYLGNLIITTLVSLYKGFVCFVSGRSLMSWEARRFRMIIFGRLTCLSSTNLPS